MELIALEEKKSIETDESQAAQRALKTMDQKSGGKRKIVVLLGVLTILPIIAIIAALAQDEPAALEQVFATSMTLTTPAQVDAHAHEDIVIDVVMNEIPHREFPAASISIHFDHEMLEFVAVKPGDMVTRDPAGNYDIPVWQVDVDASNQYGRVNAMYLDLTGGDHPYVINDADILLQLVFRLHDEGAQSGKVHHLVIDDAVLATVDPSESVGTALGNLSAHHAQIIIR